MWSNPGQDPGGPADMGPPQNPSSSQELSDLKDQYDQQQLLISQLKELLRKTEQTNVTQEKVEKYANTLTKMNERAKRNLVKKEGSREVVDAATSKRIETPASEKINMLRQQLEQNKVKLAERGKNQKGLEEMVIQIKAQLDDSQNLINQTPLNLCLMDTKVESYSASSSSQELYNILLNKEKKISDMSARIQKLDANILDLQENLKEKDSVIDARTKAITLMSENLSKKGKSTLDALDETKLQMRKMQENFVELEMQMKNENQKLTDELGLKNSQVISLQEANDFLQKTRLELLETISELQNRNGEQQVDLGKSEILNLNNRIRELKEINCNLQADFSSNSGLKEKNSDLEKCIAEKEAHILELKNAIDDLNVAKNKAKMVDFDIKLENEEVTKIKKQLDESNKNMIKVKAQHKSKIKELNKKIDNFKKMGDVNVAVLKLQDENSKLNQKLIELEEEKGALQLKIMESDSTKDSISVEQVNELEQRISEQTKTLSAKEKAISSLEKQIEDYVLHIELLNESLDNITHQQNVQVKSEITSIHLEEQLDKLEFEKQELLKEKNVMLKENEELHGKIETLKKEKQEISGKLESYIQENIDLMDKLEKLSAEKVSSAESIEIVEGLTQQEKLELEAYQKTINISSEMKNSNEHLEENTELNESVHQLTEETTELLQRIELFTVERREVMEKMELLTQENNNLNLKLKEIENNRDVLAETYEQLQNEKELLDTNLENIEKQKLQLELKLNALENENENLRQEIDVSEKEKASEKVFQTEIISDLHSTTQLTNENLLKEIEEYKTLVEIQKQEINELRVQLMQVNMVRDEKVILEEKLTSLQSKYEKLLSENMNFKQQVKQDIVHEKNHLEKELTIAKKQISEFEEKITSNLDEIETYKSTLEDNKTELLVSAKLINDLRNHIQQKEEDLSGYKDEVTQLNSTISDLNAAIAQLEEENEVKSTNDRSIETMSAQLQDLKDTLNENIQQIQQYEQEMEVNSEVIDKLQKEINTLNNKIIETEHLLDCKDDEIKMLQKEKESKETEIANLQQHISQMKEDFNKACEGLKEKCYKLKAQIDANTGSIEDIRTPLEQKINELENKNKEQLEKIKKYAAGLKKKTAAYQELEQKYSEINEKWEIEHKEKETLKIELNKNSALESKVQSLLEQLNDLEKELMNVQNELDSQVGRYNKLNEEFTCFKEESTPKRELVQLQTQNVELQQHVSQYSLQLEDLQNVLKEYESKFQILTAENDLLTSNTNNDLNAELTQKDETITRLTVEFENLRYNSETNSNALQMKIQELDMFIETQDAELLKYKDRVNKLEESLSYVEERRQSLEHKAIELDAELKEKSDDYDKVSLTEDLLEQRLNALIAHDEIIEGRLKDTLFENQELLKHNGTLTHEVDVLKSKIQAAQEKTTELKASNENLIIHEAENVQLKQIILNLENEKRHAKSEFENKINKSKTEAEKYEVELQNQVEAFNKERKDLLEDREKLNDQIKEYIEVNESIQNELEEYKQKYEEQKTLILEQMNVCEKLSEENKNNVTTISDLNVQLKNIELLNSEINNLNKLIQEKNSDIEGYQRQNLQQAAARKESNFFTFGFDASNEIQHLQQQIKNLETLKAEGDLKLEEMHRHLQNVLDELEALKQTKALDSSHHERTETPQQNLQRAEKVSNFVTFESGAGKTEALDLSHQDERENQRQNLQQAEKEPNFFTFDFGAGNEVQRLQQQIKNLETQKTEGDFKLGELHQELQRVSDELDALKQYNTSDLLRQEDFEKELASLREEKLQMELSNKNLLDENHSLQKDLSKLRNKIEILHRPTLEEAVEKTIENVIFEAEQRISDGTLAENLKIFTWPQTNADPFDFIAESNQEKIDFNKKEDLLENTREELLKKIKALEYMLYNSEREKEEALLQCHELSSELTRLVYDRENKQDPNVESQIFSKTDARLTQDDLQLLHKLEFEKTKEISPEDNVDYNKPITEDTMEAKSAYLCYTDMPDTKSKRPDHRSDISQEFDLVSQIIDSTTTVMSPTDQKQLHNLEFVECKPVKKSDETDYTKPVIEDKIQPKSAYLCYDPEQTGATNDDVIAPNMLDSFGENDDGWGLGLEEAKLEQEHQEKVESNSHRSQFRAQINELEEKIRVLEQARERHLDEIKQSQLKSGKLIKKLKEFKSKNEELSSQLNKKIDSFDDLNDAIQDELKLQIQNLEKRIKETHLEFEKEKLEKNNLLKRVDVLTAANERMIENKEKQDMEILSWQQRNRQLSVKLEQFEWGVDSPKHTKDTKFDETADVNIRALQAQIQELQDQLQDLTLDYEELQAMLEEERKFRVNAEKTKSVEPILENMKTESEYLAVLSEKNNLQTQLTSEQEEKAKLQETIHQHEVSEGTYNKEKTEMTSVMEQSSEMNRDLNHKLQALQSEYNELNQKYNATLQANMLTEELEQLNTSLHNELEKLRLENAQIQNKIDALQVENRALTTKLTNENDGMAESIELEEKITSLLQESDLANAEIEKLRFNLEARSKETCELKQKLKETTEESERLKNELGEVQRRLDNKTKELLTLVERSNQQHSEMEFKFSTTFQQLTEEWTQRVDQRGIDVAESWKLHLEARENEFMQVEQQLKKEIDELEEKYNGLVNENNELRKNVDTEIRNEIDRISALQKQINDRQNYINELTKLMQEKQTVIDRQQEEITRLEEKVQSLKLKIEEHDLEVNKQLNSLQLELSEKENMIDEFNKKLAAKEIDNKKATMIQEEIEKHKAIVSNLQQQISDKEALLLQNSQVINNFNQELELHKKSQSSLTQSIKEKDLHIDNLTKKLENYEMQRKYDVNIVQQQISDYQQQLVNNNNQLQQSYSQIESLTQELAKHAEQLTRKETQINKLKLYLEEREKEMDQTLEDKSQENLITLKEKAQELDYMKRLLTQNESRYEEMLSAKDIDNENLRLHLQEQVNKNEALLQENEEFIRLQTELSSKRAECDELQNKLEEENILLEEENRQLVELREIIQEQVLKIEDLQKKLYDKSRDYDALIAEIDIPQKSRKDLQTMQQEKHVTFADEIEKNAKISPPPIDDLSEPVSRAELDLALYMLHQRDVRCEELTVELMQLLEERDTLQLRLSNALREKEELKNKYDLKSDNSTKSEDVKKDSPKMNAIHKGKASAIVLGVTGTELATEATEQLKQDGSEYLTSKLSELKTVGYRKDKTLVDEQELRRLQQLSIMQQHRDEAAKLPAEAAARLVDASYTLSRDVQSPSKVLLNWLWGKSTPKVNNV